MVSGILPSPRSAAPKRQTRRASRHRKKRRTSNAIAWPRIIEWAIVAAITCAGLWFLFRQLVVSHFGVVPGDLGDSRFNAIVLEHGYRFLRGDAWHSPLWNPRWLFFPHENALAYSDNLLGALPVYALFRALGLREMVALDAWIVAVSLANFVATFLLARAIHLSRIGAAIAGFLFAFALPRGAQLNHLQLFPQFFTPLCFLCLVKMRSLRPWTVWGTFACVVLQFYAAVYVGWFLALALGITAVIGAVTVIGSRGFRCAALTGVKRLWGHGLAALLLSVVALLPMGIHYTRAQSEVGRRGYGEISNMLPRAASYLLPADYTYLYKPLLKAAEWIPMAHEQKMFAGFLALFCMFWLLSKLLKQRDDEDTEYRWWQYVFVAIWLTTVVATLWVNASLWEYLYSRIPGGGAIRAVSRITLLQLLPLGVATAWAATWLERRAGFVVATLFAALVVFENSGAADYNFSISDHEARIHHVQAALAGKGCKAFFLGGYDDGYKIHLDAMWASLESKVPTVNGYSGNWPRGYSLDLHNVRLSPVRSWLQQHNADGGHICLIPR